MREPGADDTPDEPVADRLERVTVGRPRRLGGPIRLERWDPAWPGLFAREAARIRAALGVQALAVEHVGSTAVPGLAAKPLIDVLLTVADAADEASYLPALQAAGYALRIREPEWHQHRMLTGPETPTNLHVFPAGCAEARRMLAFRDWLRRAPEDLLLYERTKRELAGRTWAFVQEYADAKAAVIKAILARAQGAASGSQHPP